MSPPASTVGDKLTVIVKFTGVPVHPPALGVTVIVEVMGFEVVFVAVNGKIEPLPLAAKPVVVLSFVQLKVVPVPEKLIAVVCCPAQTF
jgi:hypothetical protein